MTQININKDLITPCVMNCGPRGAYLAFSHYIPKKR